ncbi:MAG: hypothetical protein HW421_1214 [Ignavibacteria bacterium]|nr:hypothetical protein [Ignavibacteria bacterium]
MPQTVTVQKIMTKDVFTIGLEDTVHRADEIMKEENVRHVPVVDGGKLVGLITERSLREYTLRNLYEFDESNETEGRNKISDFHDIMTEVLHIVYPDDSVEKAVKLMTKYKVECLPVVDWNNNLVGILTTYDALLFLHNKLAEGKVL